MTRGLGLEPLPADRDPFITVVMPVRNEADFIERGVRAVLDQDYPTDLLEIIVADGMSDDGTPDLVRALAASHPDRSLTVLANPDRIVPTGLNLALAQARGDLVIRVDGHCEIEPGYLRRCVDVSRATGAECVGGPIHTIGADSTARSIAAAQSSRFGVGGVAFRTSEEPGSVDTLAFGAYRREVFEQIGTFDEELVRNQDDEFNLRLTRAGGVIWMDPSIRSTYYARGDLRSLFRQYHQYGLYKVRVMQKHRTVPSLRHLVPAVFVLGLAGAAGLSLARRRVWPIAAAAGPYLGLTLYSSVHASRDEDVALGEVAAATVAMHVGYGSGTWRGVWRFRRGLPAERGQAGSGTQA